MKRTLQWKFIRTAMMAVTVLLLVLLGAINLLNWWQVERQTDWMLQVLTQGDAPPVEPKRVSCRLWTPMIRGLPDSFRCSMMGRDRWPM